MNELNYNKLNLVCFIISLCYGFLKFNIFTITLSIGIHVAKNRQISLLSRHIPKHVPDTINVFSYTLFAIFLIAY